MDCSTPGLPVHQQLPEITQTNVHWDCDAIQPSQPLSTPPPTFSLSQYQGLFKWVSSSHQVAKVLELQLQHQSFQWIFRTDFFRMDWLDLLAVQGTLKSLFQRHSSKASILWCSAFFIVQLSHPYMTTGKTRALTRWSFVGKLMSLLFNMLSRLVIAYFTKSKCLLISWLQSPSAVILEPPKIKSATVSTVPCSMYLANHSSVFLYLSLQTIYNWELSHHHYSLTNIRLQIIQNPFHFTLLTYLTGIQKTHMIWYRKILTFTPSITWFSCCSALWSSSSEEKWIQPIPLWKPVSLSLKIQNLGRN